MKDTFQTLPDVGRNGSVPVLAHGKSENSSMKGYHTIKSTLYG